MESLLDHFSGLRIVAACYTEAYFPSSFPYSLAFRVIIHSLHSKSSSTVWRSEPLSLLSFGVQSHHLFSVWRLKPPSLLSYSVQSCHIFSVTTFRVVLHSLALRATISSQIRRSKPPSLFSLGFRATIPY